jgi:hypothetical protein
MVSRTELPDDIAAAIDQFGAESSGTEGRAVTRAEALDTIVRDWLIGHGFLELPPEREDAN